MQIVRSLGDFLVKHQLGCSCFCERPARVHRLVRKIGLDLAEMVLCSCEQAWSTIDERML